MSSSEKKETKISIRDLLFYYLRKWRFIVVLFFVCATLLGAYRAVKLLSMIRSSDYRDQAWELYEQAVDYRESETERLDRETVIQEKKLEVKSKYLDESLLMTMDPDDSCIASADVYISGDTGTARASLLSSIFQSAFRTGKISQELADQVHIKREYIQELLRLSSKEYVTTFANEEEQSIIATDRVLLHIGLIAGDENMARKLMDGLVTSFNNLNKELTENSQIDMQNNVAFLNFVYTTRRVEELDTYQVSIRDEVKNISKNLEDLQEKKDALEIPVYELMSLGSVFRSSLKYFLGGGFVGGCLSLILLFFACLYSDKILSPEELESRTNMTVFAVSGIRKKRIGVRIDQLIDKCELKSELTSIRSTAKLLELDDNYPQYVIWGTQPEGVLNAMIPNIGQKTILNLDQMDSWCGLLPEKDQAEIKVPTKYILFANREQTTYKEINYKLGVISKLKGTNIICILCI